jgi:hypothetical protein
MPIPSSGPLSFSIIANALPMSIPTPYSLRSMSAEVGFSTPDNVSEFYGYGNTLTEFFRTPYSDFDPFAMCNQTCDFPAYHNGVNALPTIGDLVYDDLAGTMPIFSDGGYYGMEVIQYDSARSTFACPNKANDVIDIRFC